MNISNLSYFYWTKCILHDLFFIRSSQYSTESVTGWRRCRSNLDIRRRLDDSIQLSSPIFLSVFSYCIRFDCKICVFLQRDLLALQKLDATYLLAPEGPTLASMAAWLEATTRPSVATLEKHIRSSPVLQEKLKRLVPHAVSRDDFWERYV